MTTDLLPIIQEIRAAGLKFRAARRNRKKNRAVRSSAVFRTLSEGTPRPNAGRVVLLRWIQNRRCALQKPSRTNRRASSTKVGGSEPGALVSDETDRTTVSVIVCPAMASERNRFGFVRCAWSSEAT
jgi:hypothetical protein